MVGFHAEASGPEASCRHGEVGMVKDVEEFRAELYARLLSDIGSLEHCEIKVIDSRSTQINCSDPKTRRSADNDRVTLTARLSKYCGLYDGGQLEDQKSVSPMGAMKPRRPSSC